MRVGRFVTGLVLLVVFLTGCTSRVEVGLFLGDGTTPRVSVAAEFTGEVAQVLHDDDASFDELVAVFTDRGVEDVKTVREPDEVRVSGVVDVSKLGEISEVTGVAGVSVSGDSDTGPVKVFVELRDAAELVSVLGNVVASQPDEGALFETMARGTVLQVEVEFAGRVVQEPAVVGVASDAVSVTDTAVVISRTVFDAGTGGVTVVGDPNGGVPWLLILSAGGVLGVVGLIWWAARRDRVAPLEPADVF